MKKTIKILIIISTLLNTFYIDLLKANATTYTATITDIEGVNVRSAANTNSSVLGVLSYNAKVTLNSNTKHQGSGCNGWYQITYNGKNGYICSELVSVKSDSTIVNNAKYYTTTSYSARANENYINVRSTANGSIIEKIYLGTDVNILEKTTDKTNCSKGWYKISYYNNKTGYACGDMIEEYQNITAKDDAYYQTLREKGFPESYLPYLTYLHQKHPNWIFTAIKTNKTFNNVVNGEQGKNYTQSTYDAHRTSPNVAENPNWYVATNGVNAFYLDPRNYLTEKNIFAFEELAYDKTNHTSNIIKSIFGSSYLSKDEYVGYFMEAANSYNISPVHLATRVRQEGGTNESYDGVSGNSPLTYRGKSLKGYYNYYNIGAYQDSYTSSSVARGLAVAAGYVDSYYGVPWKTRRDAIVYGAKFIADAYINKGQNTMYFQKFNTGPNNYYASYTNQYMTNIIAPASESLSTYYSYKDQNLLETAYTFAIPIYNDMPSAHTMLPPMGNTDNNLASIKINNTNITGFDEDVILYEYYIPNDTKAININATPKVSTSTVTGTGTINISETNQITTATIIVTSQVGTTKTYTINLIKSQTKEEEQLTPNEIIDKLPIKYSNEYLTNISLGTTPTNIANEINKLEAGAKIIIKDKNGKEKNTILATGDTITITSKNQTKTFTLSLKGDPSGDGKISAVDYLLIQKHILKYKNLENEYKDASDVNNDGKVSAVDYLLIQKHILGYSKIN